MNKSQVSLGMVIIVAGVIILLGKTGIIPFMWSMLWPLFILGPGVLFHFLHFNRMGPAGLLVPGGILTVYGLLFLFCNVFGWNLMGYLWPVFILGVSVGLYELYLFNHNHPKGLLISAGILAIIAAVFFGFALLFGAGIYVIAFALIVGGVYVIYRRPKSW